MIDLDDIAKNIKVRYDDKADELSIKNVLHALLNNIFAFKHITFESCENYTSPKPLSYYCWNFLPSGGIKTALIRDLNGYLFNWFFEEIKDFNKLRLEKMQILHETALAKITDKSKLKKKIAEFEQEEKNFLNVKTILKETSSAKLYNYVKIINEENKGSLLFVDTEAGKTFEKAKINKNEIKDVLFDTYLDLFDGDFYPTDTVQTDREHISDIPTSLIFTCDYSDILENQKVLQSFKKFLKTGFARRTFFYSPVIKNVYDTQIYEPDVTEKAIHNIVSYISEIKQCFDNANGNYKFSVEANKRIKEYKREIDKKLKEINKYGQNLPMEEEIIQIDLRHSTWKIIKLSVLYHLLDNPTNDKVQVDDFERATAFFNESHECLKRLVKQQSTDEVDYLFNFLLDNINKKVSNDTLRRQKFVSNPKFTKWLEDIEPIIIELAKSKGLGYARFKEDRNSKFYALYDADHTVMDGRILHTELPEGSLL